MDRISIYTDIDNLAEILTMDRSSSDFIGMKQFISKESILTICEIEEVAVENALFQLVALELASGDFTFKYREEGEEFLDSPFRTNLHQHFQDKRTIFFSYDNDRIEIAKNKTGVLFAGIGEEVDLYKKLNFKREFFRGDKILTIGKSFQNYEDLKPLIMPFFEIIINEPYLFKPDRNDWDPQEYINNNFKPLIDSLIDKTQNKINVIITTFVNEHNQHEFPYFEQAHENEDKKGFKKLYALCTDYLNSKLGANRFKLWLLVSPFARLARHDRFVLTNYQYIESPAGLTYFNDQGDFVNRGEAIYNYSILHDDARKELIPNVLKNLQEKVINKLKVSYPHRIYGIENGDSYFLKFE